MSGRGYGVAIEQHRDRLQEIRQALRPKMIAGDERAAVAIRRTIIEEGRLLGMHIEDRALPVLTITMLDRLPTWLVRCWHRYWAMRYYAAQTSGHWLAARRAVDTLRDEIERRRWLNTQHWLDTL